MNHPINTKAYLKKFSEQEDFTQEEVRALYVAYKQQLSLNCYLAECHAATAEHLPASASKSEKTRMVSICTQASGGLGGLNKFNEQHFSSPESSSQRCMDIAAKLNKEISDSDSAILLKRKMKQEAARTARGMLAGSRKECRDSRSDDFESPKS